MFINSPAKSSCINCCGKKDKRKTVAYMKYQSWAKMSFFWSSVKQYDITISHTPWLDYFKSSRIFVAIFFQEQERGFDAGKLRYKAIEKQLNKQ